MKKIHIALFFALSVLFFLTSCFIRNSMLAVFSEPVENATVLINSTEQTTPYAALFKSGSNITLEVPEFQRHDLNEKIAGKDAEYSFESWSDGKQERKRELKIDNDSEELTFKLFAKFKVEIALNVPLTDDATIVYSEWHDYGSEVKFEALLIPGYEFSHWEVESGSTYFFNQQSAGIRMVIYYPTLITAHYMEIETFRINTVALPPEGGITSGDGHYRKNEIATLEATPSYGYSFHNWSLNGEVVSTNSNYSFEVTEDSTYVASFSKKIYIISASSGNGGTIDPYGEIQVIHGESITFDISAADGYEIDDVLVDGSSVGKVSSYTFNNVTSDHTIEATFKKKTYTIVATAGSGGSISPSGNVVVEHGTSKSFTITPDSGCEIDDVLVDGSSIGKVSGYTFDNVTSNHTIEAAFKKKTYTIVATAGSGGSISPSGNVVVEHGSSKSFTITPDSGYEIDDVLVDGSSVGKVSSYTFDNVTSDHTIEATFKKKTYTVSLSVNLPDSGILTGEGEYYHGETVNISAAANQGFKFVNWTENSAVISDSSDYSFEITSDRSFTANFVEVFSVTFIVSDNDGFLQGASVEFNGETKTTDTNGRAMFEQVVPGNDLPYAVKKGGYSDYSGTLDVIDSSVEEYVTLAKAAPTLIIDDADATSSSDVWISIRAKDIESISAIRIVIQFDPAYFTWSQSTSSIQFIEPLALDPTGILIWGSKMPEDLKDEIIDFSVALDHVADLSGEQEILRVKLKAKSITGQSTLHLAEYTATTGVKVRNQIIDKNGKDLGPMQLVPGVITINQ